MQPIVQRCRGPIQVALADAGLAPQDISHVLLVGGPTMMPIVQRTIAKEFRENSQLTEELGHLAANGFPVHPMEAVAQGAVLGVVGKVAPHGYGILVCDKYYEMLARRQRYPAKGSQGFRYWGDDNTFRFSLLRQAMDPETRREEYIQLGLFEFDCVPMDSVLFFSVDWEYTDNGLLHLEVAQPGGVSMPLYDVSRLDGHPVSDRGGAAWTKNYWSRRGPRRGNRGPAVNCSRRCVSAKACLRRPAPRSSRPRVNRERHLERLTGELAQWLDDEAADADFRTPHVRDLGRSLLNLLHVSRLVDAKELAALNQNL